MQILVTGSNGQLGSELREIASKYKDHQFLFTDIGELDITSAEAIALFFKGTKIDCVINCAGFTAVDKAESDVMGANLLNGLAAGYLAEAASKAKALMIHISTDYVFDGKNHKPYSESDATGPKTAYGKSKLNGEVEVIFNASRSVIIRTSWLYSHHGHNFVKTILNKARETESLRVVYDQIGTPTYAADLATAILDIIPKLSPKVRGEIYNYSNEGVCSWYDFALAIIEMQGIKCGVTPVQSKEFKTAAARPHYSVLDKARFRKDFGREIPHWRESLKRCLEKM